MIGNQRGSRASMRSSRNVLKSVLTLFFVSFLLTSSSAVLGSTINYGDFTGANVTFESVRESSETDAVPLFGAPLATTNSLAFSPIAFGSSAQGNTSDVTDSQLRMTISSNSMSNGITFIVLNEIGDFTLQGPSDGEAHASVGAAVFWTILEVDGEPLPGPLPQGNDNVQFNGAGMNGGEFSLPNDAGAALPWSGQYVLDVDGFLLDNGINGAATKVEFTFDNSLSTFADSASAAHIKKKEAQQITVTAVPQLLPEPSTGFMLFPVVLAMLLRRRR